MALMEQPKINQYTRFRDFTHEVHYGDPFSPEENSHRKLCASLILFGFAAVAYARHNPAAAETLIGTLAAELLFFQPLFKAIKQVRISS